MSAWFSVTGLSLKIEKTNIVKISSNHLQNDLFQITYENKTTKGSCKHYIAWAVYELEELYLINTAKK